MKRMLDFYRFLHGFVIICISGGFPERFLNLCNREKIYLWDTQYKNGSIIAKVRCKDFYKFQKIRRKSGVNVKILDKVGLFFLMRKNKKRRVISYGLAASIVLMTVMNLFVWCIEVKDTVCISKEEIYEVGLKCGLDFGTFVPLYDESDASRELINTFDGRVIWSALNIKGSKASFEIREYTEESKKENKKEEPSNIIADFDGIIISSEIYSGSGEIESGSAVKKGDLLISGISQNNDGSVNFHNADGKISALHSRKIDNKYSINQKATRTENFKASKKLNVFSLNIPLSLKAFLLNDTKQIYTENLKIGDCLLPFGRTMSCSFNQISFDFNAENPLFYIDEFTREEYSLLKNSKVLNAAYSFTKEKNCYNISAEYDCIDFIGKKCAILQEN